MRVCFEGVSKQFGNVVALADFTLEVADREFLVLLGPSGCGKTTALRLVAGLEEASAGRIYLGDRLVNDVPAKDRNVAMVFQNYALYPHMSVYDNLAFGLRMRKYPRREQDRLVRQVAATLGLQELLRRRPAELSGGQRQRVALGRAIVRQPTVFLMDEPLSNLDAKLRGQTRAELIKLHARLATTFIYVTHDQVEAMTMGQRVAVLEQGVLQQVGSPREVYDRPANRFVAEFIGSPPMNFLEAEPAQVDGQQGLRAADLFFRLPPARWAPIAEAGARQVVVGIRPEHLLVQEGESDALRAEPLGLSLGTKPQDEAFAASFDGEVDLIEALGSEQHVTVTLPHHTVRVRLPADLPLRTGSTLCLAVAEERLHLFDAETGRRIDG